MSIIIERTHGISQSSIGTIRTHTKSENNEK